MNEQDKPAENATVELYQNKDSALVKTAITNREGLAYFIGISRHKESKSVSRKINISQAKAWPICDGTDTQNDRYEKTLHTALLQVSNWQLAVSY